MPRRKEAPRRAVHDRRSPHAPAVGAELLGVLHVIIGDAVDTFLHARLSGGGLERVNAVTAHVVGMEEEREGGTERGHAGDDDEG